MKTIKLVFALVCSFVVAGAYGNVSQNFFQDIKSGNLEKVKFYISSGGNVNAKNKYGLSPLMAATMEGHVSIVELLIKEGADVNEKPQHGPTAFISTIHAGSIDMMKAFIRAGVNVHMKDSTGDSAYTWAVRYDNMKMVRLLRKASRSSDRARSFRRGNTFNNANLKRAMRSVER